MSRLSIPGSGLAKGLAVTLRTMTKKTVTEQYPDVQPELPPRTRGVIGLFEENCTVCMLCARECPDWCIYIDSHKETIPAATPGGRDRSRNVLDRFAIDFSLCMYCGICIEVCPFDALFWSPEFEYSETDIRDLTHERDKLREWMWTVPAPPALDPGAEEPKELAAARKTADKLAAQQETAQQQTAQQQTTRQQAARAAEPHADEQARAAEQPTRPMGDSKQQTDQPGPTPDRSEPRTPGRTEPRTPGRTEPRTPGRTEPRTTGDQPDQEGRE
ncbi:NADH-quinone oxidoreductase subunit I [Streptomyces sp. b94]|uniref:NuoI/complex I 23 kDa subunit family protein n=1 Tax=Streptomyces sp. b94 TaxID=1827634 RepID=UPI001FFDDB50|nr:NADH-quinone oxidoreductase subunit I [Streptomyces sp. b94]